MNKINDSKHLHLSDFSEGNYELSPVILKKSKGEATEYPLVAPLDLRVNHEALFQEYLSLKEMLSFKYLEERKHALPIPLTELKELMSRLGFKQCYRAIGLMKVGTNELKDELLPESRKLLESLSPMCRAHYVRAKPGLNIKPHADCSNFRVHGFRIHIPLNNNAEYRFKVNGSWIKKVIYPGRCWFFNNAVPHTASNTTSYERVSIMLQMMSDEKLIPLLGEQEKLA